MPEQPIGEVIIALQQAAKGDVGARDRLFTLIYDEVRKTARSQRFVGSHGETLQPTALASEAYLALHHHYPSMLKGTPDSRRLFFDALGKVMRTILRDHGRKGGAGGRRMVALGGHDATRPEHSEPDIDPAALHDAMERLDTYNKRWAMVVHYRFFAGRTNAETAELMDIAESTVKSDWRLAQAWLARELGKAAGRNSLA